MAEPDKLQMQLLHILKLLGSDPCHGKEKYQSSNRLMKLVLDLDDNCHSDDQQDKSEISSLLERSCFTCFVCRKNCLNRNQFLKHFCGHLKDKAARSSTVSEPDTNSEDDQINPARRRISYSKFKIKKKKLMLSAYAEDIDSGCHSVESSSTDQVESDCFLGDSESSDSDENDQKENRLERRRQKKEMLLLDNKVRNTRKVTQKDRLSLAEKQLDNNETEGLICLTCLKRFSNCQNLRRHLRLHIARDSTTPDFEAHGNGYGGEYSCDWCPERFENRSAARIHESTHKGQDFKCYVCDKIYADRYSLRYHLRTHGIGRQIRCEYCNKSFSKPSRLESHIKSHHKNIRDFKCNLCDKAFKTSVHLKNHRLQHSGERPFACPVCNDRFRQKSSLNAHLRSHNNDRPFCCEFCGKTFREPSTLKAHTRTHTREKPYKCELCEKSFKQRAGLNYHKMNHSGSKPFKCQFCRFSTAKKSTLVGHYQRLHSVEAKAGKSGLGGSKLVQPLPSPPIQAGDAMNMKPLPPFNDLRQQQQQQQGCLTTSLSPIPASTSPPSSLSPAESNCSSLDSYQSLYHNEANNSRQVTPPLTPPATSHHQGLEELMPGLQEPEYLPSLNASEITNQLGYNENEYGNQNSYYGSSFLRQQYHQYNSSSQYHYGVFNYSYYDQSQQGSYPHPHHHHHHHHPQDPQHHLQHEQQQHLTHLNNMAPQFGMANHNHSMAATAPNGGYEAAGFHANTMVASVSAPQTSNPTCTSVSESPPTSVYCI